MSTIKIFQTKILYTPNDGFPVLLGEVEDDGYGPTTRKGWSLWSRSGQLQEYKDIVKMYDLIDDPIQITKKQTKQAIDKAKNLYKKLFDEAGYTWVTDDTTTFYGGGLAITGPVYVLRAPYGSRYAEVVNRVIEGKSKWVISTWPTPTILINNFKFDTAQEAKDIIQEAVAKWILRNEEK
jgi:hypothetical protein